MGAIERIAAPSSAVTFLPNGLQFNEAMTFEEWRDVGEQIKASVQGHQWWIGDWLRFGGHKWGDKYEAASTLLGLAPATLKKFKYMADAYPDLLLRSNKLAFTHHEVAAALPGDSRQAILEQAAENEWSAARLRAAVRELQPTAIAGKVEVELSGDDDGTTWEILNCDVVEGLQSLFDRGVQARVAFTDPPYNIGIDYGKGKKADALPDDEYMQWVREWLWATRDCLTDDGSMWVMINDEYAAEYAIVLKSLGLHIRSWIKWYETFGVNCSNKFNRTSRHIFYCVKDPKNFVFNKDAVTRPSDRQTKYNDPRAAEGGKIWDDVWQIPRLFGTAVERLPDFPTQLPLALVRPIVECASDAGDLVIDPFNGSGTTGVAAIETGRSYIGIELSEVFASKARTRLSHSQRPLIRSVT